MAGTRGEGHFDEAYTKYFCLHYPCRCCDRELNDDANNAYYFVNNLCHFGE